MALAVAFGVGIATGRVYGDPLTRAVLTLYVEVMRGTPVLLQLFVIYYGLSAVIRLPAFAAALIGLGLNYAAYESEIYRSALQAVPRGQLEAARILGLTEAQIFATNVGSWLIPGLLCAGLYLAMSLPLAHVARRLESRWRTPGGSP